MEQMPTLEEAEQMPTLEEVEQMPTLGEVTGTYEPTSGLKAAALGGLQGASLNLADEAEAAAKAVGQTPVPLSPQASLLVRFKEAYKREIPKTREEYARAKKDQPLAYGASELAGGVITTAPLTALTGGAALGAGIATGAVQAAGASEAKTGRDLIEDVGVGALFGSAGGALQGYGSKMLGGAADKVKGLLESVKKTQGAKAIGASKKSFGKTFNTVDRKAEVLGESVDRGVVTALGSTKDQIAKVKDIREKAVNTFKDVEKSLEDVGAKVDPESVASQMSEFLATKYDDPDMTSIVGKALDDIRGRGDTPQGLRALKEKFATKGYSNGQPVLTEKGAMYRDLAQQMDDQYVKVLDNAIEQSDNQAIKQAYLTAKKDYGYTKDAERALASKLAGEKGNVSMGMIDTGTIISGILSGNLPASMGIVAGRKLFKEYGSQMSATGASALKRGLDKAEMDPAYLKALIEAAKLASVRSSVTKEK